MATPLDDAPQSGGNNGSYVQHVEQPNENLTPEMDEKIISLRQREHPVNILVIGPGGAGKSTLVNSMFGKDVAEVGHGATAITTEVHEYKREYEGVKIRIYDTIGFGDTEGKSDRDILLDIAKHGKFDLILICLKLGDRVDRAMFLELASMLHEEMWERTVVVLTQADRLYTLASVVNNDIAGEIRKQIKEYKACVVRFLSKSVTKEVLDEIPYCIAGKDITTTSPTTDNWWKTLWETCIDRSSDETRHFLTFYAKYQHAIEVGAVLGSAGVGAGMGAGLGAKLGATFGAAVSPGVGTVAGSLVGGAVGGTAGAVAVAASKKNKNN